MWRLICVCTGPFYGFPGKNGLTFYGFPGKNALTFYGFPGKNGLRELGAYFR